MFLWLTLLLLGSPIPLDAHNTVVTFEVDSTWHLIHGTVKDVSGKIWFENNNDLSSGKVLVTLPVKGFDTDNSIRDDRLREVMEVGKYPDVIFKGEQFTSNCNLSTIEDGKPCAGTLEGTVQIRNVQSPLVLNVTGEKKGSDIIFHGESSLEWDTFGVEDPSILVAKLQKRVNLAVHVTVPLKQ